MPRSFRLDAELERRLREAAEKEGIAASAFIRDAISRRCDEVLERSLLDDLKDEIAIVTLPPDPYFRSDRTSDVFGDLVAEKLANKPQQRSA